MAATLWHVNYYDSIYPFINLVRQSGDSDLEWRNNATSELLGPSIENSNGWLEGLPSGVTARLNVLLDIDSTYGYVPPGNYVIKTTANATVSVQGSGLSSISPGYQRGTFTIDAAPNDVYGGYTLQALVTNNSGGPIDVADLVICRAELEQLHDTGEIFDPVFLDDVKHYKVLRFMDWTAGSSGGETEISQLRTESRRSWGNKVPHSVCAKLCKKIGSDPWVHFPNGSQALNYVWNATTDRVETRDLSGNPKAHGWQNGDEIVFYDPDPPYPSGISSGVRYYARNVTTYTAQLSTTPSGSIIDITSEPGSWGRVTKIVDMQPVYDHIANVWYENYPEGHFYVEMGNEPWNSAPGFEGYHFFREVISNVVAGAGLYAARGYAYQSLKGWKAMEKKFPRKQYSRVLNSFILWDEFVDDTLTFTDPGILQSGQTVAQLLDTDVDIVASAPYFDMGDTSGGSYVQISGDALLNYDIPSQDDNWFIARFYEGCTYLTQRVAAQKAVVQNRRANLKCSIYETGLGISANAASLGAQYVPIRNRIIQFMDGPNAVTVYQDYYDRMIEGNGLTLLNHYTAAGGYFSNTYLFFWGAKRTHHISDTPRSAWIKAAPGLEEPFRDATDTARVFISGHSLSAQPYEGTSDLIASSLSRSYDWEWGMKPGSAVQGRTGTSPNWTQLTGGDSALENRYTTGMNVLAEWATPTTVSGPYTHVCVTERHDIMLSLQYADTLRYMMVFYQAARARMPNAKIMLWSCWWPMGSASNINNWLAYEKSVRYVWDALLYRINLRLANLGVQHRMYMAPVQYMVIRLVERCLEGVSGLPSTPQGILEQIFELPDGTHLDASLGRYYMSCMEHCCVFRRSPVGAARWTSGNYPNTSIPRAITEEQATALQTIAWDAYREYFQREQTTWSMDRVRDHIVNDVHPKMLAYTPGAFGSSFGVDTSFYSSTSYASGNPFIFDAATDESSAGWLSYP